ncbi:MAG TPA: alpha-ketoglutarate-dependent dioxygenase AlkB [Vicinamibacterales bacterium]|jgi:alkylated DNA repair protein (DNA oxidative demethylase)|nr:alpha-ketoglutarate-dependent dioxygenase AlkB [Vicinamibacterales bacterium]
MHLAALEPGVTLLEQFLPAGEQRRFWEVCAALASGPVPMYTPTVRGGRKMSVGMLCLGRHWNALTYAYEPTRSDFDNLPAPPLPGDFVTLASEAAARAGFDMQPDLCIMNFYDAGSRMGVHQDKDERRDTIEAGVPIVSVSLGDTARFVLGGLTRREPTRPILLRSGDVFVMGGPARLRFHGVTRILPGTAPPGTGPGRFNLTFRKY